MFFCYPGDDMLTGITATNDDPEMPASNALTDDPSVPMHIFGTSTDMVLTSSNAVAEAIFMINLPDTPAAVLLMNGGGIPVNTPIPIPDRVGLHGENVWVDLRAGTTATTTRTILLGGLIESDSFGVGRIFLAEHLRSLHVVTSPKFKFSHLDTIAKTVSGYNFTTPKRVKNRSVEISTIHATEQAKLELLYDQCNGRDLPFPLIPWEDRTSVWWVKFSADGLQWEETEGAGREKSVMKLTVQFEQWMGLPLDFPV